MIGNIPNLAFHSLITLSLSWEGPEISINASAAFPFSWHIFAVWNLFVFSFAAVVTSKQFLAGPDVPSAD